MKKGKRLLCYVLICVCIFDKSIVFADSENYNSEALEEVYTLYNWNESFLDILKKKEGFSYRQIADYYEHHKVWNALTNVSAYILGQHISEDKYVEMLSEIMTLNQYVISEQIEEYGSYNTTKNFADFLNDASDIVFSMEDIEKLFEIEDKKSESLIYKTLKYGEKAWSKGIEFDELTEDGKKYYQTLLESYIYSNQFLTTVANNSDVRKLQNAAKKLISANDSMFLKQYYYINKMGVDIIKYSAQSFLEEVAVPATEMLEKYAADAETAKIFSNISNVGGELIAGKALFDLIIFLGDYSVGTSDTFAYLQRIKAIDEIASAIINEIDKVDVDSYIDSTERYKAIVNKCSWYRWLITINGRGESYASTMLTNENNVLTDIDDLQKKICGELTLKEKYDRQLEALVRFNENYLQPIFDIDVFADEQNAEAENADINNKYLEFMEQYKEQEVFYSIQNIKEGGLPILLIVSSSENEEDYNEEDYEVIDDKSIHSKRCDVYDYVDGEIVQVGSIFSLSGYLSLYTKDTEDYVATRINTHSIYFTCIEDNKLYTYGYNTNNIVEDIVDYEEDGEYYDYAYGTTNYDDAIGKYSEVGEIVFEKIPGNQTSVNDEIDSAESNSSAAYRNLIMEYEETYGSANLNTQEQFWTGLCFAKLLDFNGDGVDELILAYQTEPSNIDNVEYTVELWGFDGVSVQRIASQISWTGNNMPYFGGFSIAEYEGKYLLVLTDNAGCYCRYYGMKDDGTVGLVHEFIWKGDAMQGDWYLDNEKISMETYEEYSDKYSANAVWYGFSEASCNETIKKEISQTKNKLKM